MKEQFNDNNLSDVEKSEEWNEDSGWIEVDDEEEEE